MHDILIRGMCKLESGKSYRALFKELNGKFVVVVELVESYADREVEIYPVEELPPHGDLIDRDEASNTIKPYCHDDVESAVTIYDAKKLIHKVLDSAKVIVPAEKGETRGGLNGD